MQRKVFRIEQMLAGRRGPGCEPAALRAPAERREEAIDASLQGLEAELARLRETVARNRHDLADLLGPDRDRRFARAAGELGASIDAMEKATKSILDLTENIDDSAKSLVASLKQGHERGLAQDIQEHAGKIYEACNFQDLTGQRIAKVIAMLGAIEEQIGAALKRCSAVSASVPLDAKSAFARTGLINGPKLDGDAGHADQSDIDAMFDGNVSRAAGSR